jgi:hypothetical protein
MLVPGGFGDCTKRMIGGIEASIVTAIIATPVSFALRRKLRTAARLSVGESLLVVEEQDGVDVGWCGFIVCSMADVRDDVFQPDNVPVQRARAQDLPS